MTKLENETLLIVVQSRDIDLKYAVISINIAMCCWRTNTHNGAQPYKYRHTFEVLGDEY